MVETWMPTLVPNVAARRWRTQQLMISSGDVVHAVTGKNKYGSTSDFNNEASVEQFFVARLLDDLGYVDAQIRPKASLKELTLHLGRRTVNWRPDFALTVDGRIRWIVEAKAPTESLEDWEGQASSYCLELNKAHEDNPVEFFLLTNGLTSRVYRWDQGKFVLEAAFEDFVDGNPRFSHMRELLAPDALRAQSTVPVERHTLRRHNVDKLNADFAWAHRTIFRAEALSYTAAFMEFVKIIFLKLQSDHDAHNNPAFQQDDVDAGSVPRDDVRFSVHWIERYEAEGIVSPLDELYFKSLSKDFEAQIAESKMKRIFEPGEGIKLSADTIKNLVGRFQHIDLRSIDADLNGRMFETFLNAALRGKDLGQFFTPRSVVKLATALADLRVDGDTPTRVMDACCGTGGFLIEALSVMNDKVDALPLGALGKAELLKKVQRSIIGVDVARDPALARIARINMYLHGDADSHIYQLDALDKKVAVLNNDIDEIRREKKEFAALLRDGEKVDDDGRPHGVVDVVLSNPPFAKEYNRREKSEARLLDEYELASRVAGGKSVKLQKLSSMVMFLERYYDLLAPGGTLVTVLDDGILGARKNAFVREWIQRKWLIKAVVSLPGDAFQRSQARVKTSILVLEKKKDLDETQPNVFMYYCGHVGVDDSPRQRALPVDVLNRQKATDEIATVVALWEAFKRGDAAAQPWTVRAEDLGDRLDVKANLIRSGEQVSVWQEAGLKVVTADTLLQPVASSRSFVRADADGLATYLRVRYDGFCEAGDEFAPEEAAATKFTRVRAGDLVFSHINAVHGAVGVVPAELDGFVVTNEYSVCRAINDADTPVVWTLLRSTQARADLIALATGIGRTRVSWTEIQKLRVPWPGAELRQRIRDAFEEANAAEATARRLRREVTAAAAAELSLDPERAREVISAFKPPR